MPRSIYNEEKQQEARDAIYDAICNAPGHVGPCDLLNSVAQALSMNAEAMAASSHEELSDVAYNIRVSHIKAAAEMLSLLGDWLDGHS